MIRGTKLIASSYFVGRGTGRAARAVSQTKRDNKRVPAHIDQPQNTLEYDREFDLPKGVSTTRQRVKSPQFRWTKQLPPEARRLEHSFSALSRVAKPTRTRYQAAFLPTLLRR